MLLTATISFLINIIFCGCGNRSTTLNSMKKTQESVSFDGNKLNTVLNDYNLQNSPLLIDENLATSMSNAEEAMNGFMNSQGHRENILEPRYTTVAVSAIEMSEYLGYFIVLQIFVEEK